MTRTRLAQLWHLLADLLFPPRCAVCRQPGSALCTACVGAIVPFQDPRCLRCDLPCLAQIGLCPACQQNLASALEGLRSIGPHVEPLRSGIHALKYQARPTIAQPLGHLMAARWQATGSPVDAILPLPLHPERQRERGYNQASLLAQAMAERLTLPLREELLWRVRATSSQVKLGRAARQENMAGAFAASPAVAGGRWLLVDDVCTTSATLEEAARALREQGATAVWAITAARAYREP
ncbi:MAG: ComF family protein [Ardenticatenales bacterium]|nr:ComF family protein [Ardenticatenales bacterium]